MTRAARTKDTRYPPGYLFLDAEALQYAKLDNLARLARALSVRVPEHGTDREKRSAMVRGIVAAENRLAKGEKLS